MKNAKDREIHLFTNCQRLILAYRAEKWAKTDGIRLMVGEMRFLRNRRKIRREKK
jgi:hypothetical protein